MTGMSEMKLMSTEINSTRNDMARVGGFAPSQWVFGKLPRRGAGEQFDAEGWADFGAVQERVSGQTEFAKIAAYRQEAKEAFVKVDSSSRISSYATQSWASSWTVQSW